MKTRLNLTIDDALLAEIKKLAVRNDTTVSDLVEQYFKKLLPRKKQDNILDMVEKLRPSDIAPDTDLKELYYREKGKDAT